MLSEALLDAEARIGELTGALPKADKGNQYTGKMVRDTAVANQKPKLEVIKSLGFNPKQVERFETLANNPDIVEQVKAEARKNTVLWIEAACDGDYRETSEAGLALAQQRTNSAQDQRRNQTNPEIHKNI